MPIDKELLNRIRSNDLSLTFIDFKYNQIGDAEAKELALALKDNKTLTFIDLGFNQIGDAGAKELALALKDNKTLTSIMLSLNNISDAGAKELALALKENETLTSIDLTHNCIRDTGIIELALALKDNKTLTFIDLSGNQIRDAGAKELVSALKDNKTLTDIKLDINQISDPETKELAPALKDLKISTDLNVFPGPKELALAIEENNNLIDINLVNIAKEISSLRHYNQAMMVTRRQQFLYKMIMLARNAKTIDSISLWNALPKEIRCIILNSLNYQSEHHLGKTAKQIKDCISFIFKNIEECTSIIKSREKVKLIESKELIQGHHAFKFFKTLVVTPKNQAQNQAISVVENQQTSAFI